MANRQRPSVGIIGLGIMGGIMAETLIGQGFEVTGHDLSEACKKRLKKAGGKVARSNAEVAQQAAAGIAKTNPALDAVLEVFEDVVTDPLRDGLTKSIILFCCI